MNRSFLTLVAFLITGCDTMDPSNTASAPAASADANLQIRYVTGPDQEAIGGQLTTIETAFEPCDGATISDSTNVYEFGGDLALAEVTLPDGELCSVRLAATELIIEVLDGGVSKTIIGQDFDLVVPADALSTDGTLTLQLGDDAWLAEVLPLAAEGTTLLHSESDPALVSAFYDGLTRGSMVTTEVAGL